jgi:hypothetical protein
LKDKDKEKILKAAGKKGFITLDVSSIRLTDYFSETLVSEKL